MAFSKEFRARHPEAFTKVSERAAGSGGAPTEKQMFTKPIWMVAKQVRTTGNVLAFVWLMEFAGERRWTENSAHAEKYTHKVATKLAKQYQAIVTV